LLVGALVLTAMTVTGCGSGKDTGGEVASAASTASETPRATAPKQASSELTDYLAAQRKWVTCLRGVGFDIPDPDAKGVVDDSDLRRAKSDQTAFTAMQKCAGLQPAIPDSVEKAQRPELSAAEKGTKRRYAKCMQDNGAADFPDTDETGYYGPGEWDSTSAGAKRATRVCAPIIGDPVDPPAHPKG